MRQYLNNKDILSQCIFSQYALFLALATIRFQLSMQSLANNMGTHREAAMELCKEVENARNQADQLPRKLEQAIAILVAGFCDQIWKVARLSLLALVTILKGVFAFFVDLYLGTLTCLLTAAIRGVLDLVADVLKEITSMVESVINSFIDNFQEALSSVSSLVNGILSAFKAVESLFSDSSKLPSAVTKLNLTIADLSDIHISSNYTSKIEALADDIPDFSSTLSNITDVVLMPLTSFSEKLDSEFLFSFNDTLGQISASAVSSPCVHLDSQVSKAIHGFETSIKYCTIGMSMLLVCLVAFLVYSTHVKNRSFEKLLKELSFRDSPVEVGNILQMHQYGIFRYFVRNLQPKSLWLISYMATANLCNILAIASIGAVSGLVQIWLISRIETQISRISGAFSDSASNTTTHVLDSFIDSVQNAVNNSTEVINNELFGSVHSHSAELLEGISTFQNSLNETIFSVFGSSFLAQPLETIVYCTVGRKVETIKKGVAWIRNNTNFEPPQVQNKALLLELVDSSPSTTTAISETAKTLLEMLNTAKRSAMVECLFSVALMGFWLVYLCAGIIVASRKERKQTVWPTRAASRGFNGKF